MQPISVLFTIPEDSLPQVRKRLRDGATLPVTALDRAQKNQLGQGKVTTTDNQIDTTTGTVKLRAIFDNADEALFPNQFVNVRLLADTVKDAIIVPVAAIQRGQPGTFVYLVKADDTVDDPRRSRPARPTARRSPSPRASRSATQVVIDGVDRLRDGAKIRRPSGQRAGRAGRRSRPRRRWRRAAGRCGRRRAGAAARPVASQQGAGGERRGGGSRSPAQTNQ